MNNSIKDFFSNSEWLDYKVLRQLSHINLSWELIWDQDTEEYVREEGTFAGLLNDLIIEMAETTPPKKYHDNEDALADFVIKHLKWKIHKVKKRWVGEQYEAILEQGGFDDIDEKHLVQAATGRIIAAIKHSQLHFDDMEESHQKMLAAVLAIIVYHRINLVNLEN